MKLKKILSSAIFIIMILSTISFTAFADDVVSVWDGTATTEWFDNSESTTEYYLNSASDLAGLAKIVNEWKTTVPNTNNPFSGATVFLNVNVDLNNIDWDPIGTAIPGEKNRFYGSFNGQGHTISNLKVRENTHSFAGLFGTVPTYDFSQTFSNVTLENVKSYSLDGASGSEAAGSLIARANGAVVENCHVTGTIDIYGDRFVGGLLGHSYARVSNCSVEAEGTVICNTWQVGGLIGVQRSHDPAQYPASWIKNCSVTGTGDNSLTVKSNNYAPVGGIVSTVAADITEGNEVAVSDCMVENISLEAAANYDIYSVAYIANDFVATNSFKNSVTATVGGAEAIPSDAETVKEAVATFTISADGGYNASSRTADDKIGTLAFNAVYNLFEENSGNITNYGFYIYNTSVENEAYTIKADAELSEAEFHATVTEITDLDATVVAVPYVITDGTSVVGEAVSASVSDYMKWLGKTAE